MGCKKLKYQNFSFLEIVHSEKRVSAEKKRINYYPFGLEHKGYNNVVNGTEHKYKYNGKEIQEELGLNWYDYGARNYDASLGRWFGIDNLAEKHFNFSPYTYTANNPVLFVDFDGNDFGVLVNRAARTITIRATYLVSANNQVAFNRRGRDAYNNTSGQRVFVPGGVKALKAGRSQGYTINFELQSQVDNRGRGFKSDTVDADQTGTLNTFDSHPAPYRGLEDENGITVNDNVDVRDNRVDSSTTTHEVGHSLGVIHSSDGGALPTQGVNINNALVSEVLAGVGIGENNTNRNAQGDQAGAGDGTLLNGSTNQGLENGKLISVKRYNRIMKRVERREQRRLDRQQDDF